MDTFQQLKSLVETATLPHAILLEGPDTLEYASFLATAAVCEKSKKPCGECKHCVKAKSQNHPDVIYFEPTGASKSYPVDLIREIRLDAYILPNEADKKVFIIKDVDNISAQSQNALLKILEEPPKYILFILTCLQKSALLETVLSRITTFTVEGNQSDQANTEHFQYTMQLAKAVVLNNELDLLKLANGLSTEGESQEILSMLLQVFRNVYLIKNGVKIADNEIIALSKNLTLQGTLDIINAIIQIKNAAKWNANKSLNLTRLSALLRKAADR